MIRMKASPSRSSLHFGLRGLVLVLLLLATVSANASLLIPKSLSQSDREEALRIIGFGSSNKLLTDPYPLGGYAGFEMGLAVETLPVEDIGRLGARLDNPQQDVSFPKITIGKGLYNNIDIFFHFIPYNQQSEISQWGGAARWGFYQAPYLPVSASLLVHFNNSNISNLITTRAYGIDLIGGINVRNVALYMGGGPVSSSGNFIGGPSGVTVSGNLETDAVTGFHSVIGATVHLASVFLAMELDRYTQTVLSGKLGLRF